MGGCVSKMAKQELVATIRDRYRQSSKKDKGRILDEFTAITGHHRKHGIRLLSETADNQGKQVVGRRIYDEAVREAVIVVWEASDRICGKRLKAALPNLVDSMERHGHLSLDPLVREHLLSASAATLDRLLKPMRPTTGSRRRRKRRSYMGSQVPVRTYLELAAARLSGNRPGSPLRRDSIGILYPQPGGHRHLHGLDGGSSPAGQGAVPGDRGTGGHRRAVAFPGPRDRFGQRQRLYQPDLNGVLCRPEH